MANIFHVERTDNKITLGATGTTINIASHTASQSLALDASKNLESIDLSAVYQPLDDVLTDLAALTAVADNEFIVGTGAGTYAHESGVTVRTSIGLGTGDSPQFTGLTLTGNLTMPDDGWIGRSSSHCMLFDDTLTEVRFQSQLVSAYFDGEWNVFELQNFYTGAGNGGSYNLYRARGTQASPLAVLDSDVLGRIEVRGYDGDTWENAAAIKFYVNDTVSDGVVPCKIAFFTADSGGSWGQRASIINDGKFGIGVDAKTLLTVEGTITLKEQAAADGDTAAYGQMWVKTAVPNELWFTNDAGDDIQLTTGSLMQTPKAIYAELSDSADQTFAQTATAYSITFDTNDEIAGITHSTSVDPENITIITTGVYTIFAQPQVAAAPGGAGVFHMWLQKDTGGGFADIANTNIELSLASSEEDVIPLATTFLLSAGDIIRLRASVSDTDIKLDAQTPANEPVIPSIIFTMFMIGT